MNHIVFSILNHRAAKFLLLVQVLFLTSFGMALDHVRLTSSHLVGVTSCPQHLTASCRQVVQMDAAGQVALDFHLRGTGSLAVDDLAVNPSDQLVIAGRFSGRLSVDGRVIQARGGHDLFYLMLTPFGEVLCLNRLGKRGDDRLFAVERDDAGRFLLQGAVGGASGRTWMVWRLNEDGSLEGQKAMVTESEPTDPDSIFEDGDDDPIEDPLG